MASHLRPSHGLGPAVRLLRETVAALGQALVDEGSEIAQNHLSHHEDEGRLPELSTLDRLLSRCGVDMERLDPESAAKLQRTLIELGYIKPEEPE